MSARHMVQDDIRERYTGSVCIRARHSGLDMIDETILSVQAGYVLC
jgi:hypothetical protein